MDTDATVEQSGEAGAPVAETIKAGARNSRHDLAKIQQVHDHAVALGANCMLDEHPDAKSGDLPVVQPRIAELHAGDFQKALSLNKLVEKVQEAAYKLRRTMMSADNPNGSDPYWDGCDYDSYPQCVEVYDGYVIMTQGLVNYKANYALTDAGVEFVPQDQWQRVEGAWVAKMVKSWQDAREVGTVKALGAGRLGNYLVLWGDETKKDLYGEYFDNTTEELDVIFKTIGKIPALYQHAMDGALKTTPVGVIDVMEKDDIGLWTETQLDLSNQYAVAVQRLAQRKALGASSGTLPGARKVAPNGRIERWPIVEGSFTPNPAEPRMRSELPVTEIKAIYGALNLELPTEIKAGDAEDAEEACAETNAIDLERARLELLELESSILGDHHESE